MKSRLTIATEGLLYMVIAAGSPWAEFLISDRAMTQRSITAVSVVALVAAANALKAFLSQSIQKQDPIEVTAPKGQPLPTVETKPKAKTK